MTEAKTSARTGHQYERCEDSSDCQVAKSHGQVFVLILFPLHHSLLLDPRLASGAASPLAFFLSPCPHRPSWLHPTFTVGTSGRFGLRLCSPFIYILSWVIASVVQRLKCPLYAVDSSISLTDQTLQPKTGS